MLFYPSTRKGVGRDARGLTRSDPGPEWKGAAQTPTFTPLQQHATGVRQRQPAIGNSR